MRRLSLLAAVLLLSGAWGQQQPSPGEVRVASRPYAPHTAVLRTQSNLVEVAVVVRDNDGKPEANLTAADFALLDQGKPQPITTFSVEGAAARPVEAAAAAPPAAALAAPPAPAATPAYVALFFDDYAMTSIDLGMARNAAEKFLKAGTGTSLGASLHLGVFTTSGLEQLDFTSDASAILPALRRLTPRTRMSENGITPNADISPYLAYQITQNDIQSSPDVRSAMARLRRGQQCVGPDCYALAVADARQTVDVAEAASTDTLAALERMIAYLATRPGQRTILLASSGFLTDSLQARQDEVADAALRAGVVIDSLDAKLLNTEPVGMSPMESSLQMTERDDLNDVLSTLAATTGGEFFHNNNDMAGALRRMTAEPEVRYLLGFSPASMAEDGKFHTLKVKLDDGIHGEVQARRGYFDPAGDTDPFAHSPAEALDREVLGADTPDAVPAEIAAGWSRDAAGHSRLQVTVRVDTAHLHFAKADHVSRQQLFFVTAVFDDQNHFVAGKEGAMALALSDATLARFAAQGVTARLSLPLAAGHYRLREVIREGVKGATTALDRSIQVQ